MLTTNPTHNAIVTVLLNAGALDTKEIHAHLAEGADKQITLAQLYNILKQLYASQIISKYGKKYQINMLWINQLENTVRSYYLKTNHLDRASFAQGQTIVLKAQSLAELDPIWGDAFYSLCNLANCDNIYTYNSYVYHIIGMYATEKNFYSSTKYNFNFIVQHKNILNDYGISLYKKGGLDKIAYAKTPDLFGPLGRVINVIGPYIIDFIMPEQLEHYFTYHFSSITDMTNFNKAQFTALFDLPIQCKLHIIHDPALAQQYRNVLIKEMS